MEETMKKRNMEFSDRSKQIVEQYKAEARRCHGKKEEEITPPFGAPSSLNDYTVMLEEYLGLPLDDILSDDLLNQRLADIDNDSHLKEHYPEGREVHLGIIPCSTYGNPLSDEEVTDGEYLRQLARRHGVTYGFTLFPTYVHELMPENVRSCTFTVGKYDDPGLWKVTPADRQRIKAQYRETFNKLRQALRGQ